MNNAAKAAIGGASALLLAKCGIFASLGAWVLNLSPIWFAAAVMLVLAVAAVIAKRGPGKGIMENNEIIPARIENLIGRTFGGWTVISFSHQKIRNKIAYYFWNVKCARCGQCRNFLATKIKNNRIRKCNHAELRTRLDFPNDSYAIIPGFPGYLAGKDGSIWTCHVNGGNGGLSDVWVQRGTYPDKDGYPMITIRKNAKPVTKRLSHCILEAFIGPKPEGLEACHGYDSSPSNNRLDNLRWDTHKGNIQDKIDAGTVACGEDHGRAELTESDVRNLRQIYRDSHMTFTALGEMFGISGSHAASIVKRKYWRHVA